MCRKILILLLVLCISSPLAFAGSAQKKSGKSKPGNQPEPTSPKDINEPAQTAKPAGQKTAPKRVADNQWALLIGISQYPGQIQSLNFPRNDASAIKDLLVGAAGFPQDHVRLLTDDGAGDQKATKQNILAAIDQYLAARVKPNDQVIVFLAGHGIARGLGLQAKSFFLPVDVDAQSKESLETTAIDMEDIAKRLSNLKASQFAIFIDACREDPFPGRGIKGNTMTDVMARGLVVRKASEQQTGPPPTAVVFYACQVGERAYEDPKLSHGVFTYYILKGINDLAINPDGRVEAGYLASYLRDNVKKWSAEFQQRAKFAVEQTPMMVATELRGPAIILRMSQAASSQPAPPGKGSVTLVTSPAEANVSLNGQSLGAAPLQKELAPGEYTVKAELQGFQPTEAKVTVVAGYQQEVTITLKPAASNASYEKGVQFESQKLWPQAIISYEQALKEDPTLIAAYERLANVYTGAGRSRDAVDMLATASEKFPDNAALLARYARALSQWAEVDETTDPSSNPRPSKAVKQKDARKEAVKAAELASKRAPDLAITNLALGYAYTLDEKDRPKALNSFVRASTIAPEDAESYYGVGYTYRLMKQYQQAIPQLKKALDLRPDYYEAHRELAYCYHSGGDTDQAIHEYNTATGYRSETSNSGEMAGNHLALSALYTEKGQQVGGDDGKAISDAGKGHESEARGYDPTLKAAMKVLMNSGVAFRMTNFLPSDVRSLINTKSVDIPGTGGVKLPFPKRKP